jgi:hypothetical protein
MEPVAQATPEVKPDVKPDLITRASQVKIEPTVKEVSEPEFDYKEIEAIKDPIAKDIALKAYKSFQRGFNSKYQDLSAIRKDYESRANELSTWTPERVQKLINDPNFVEAAKNVVGTQPEQSYETETDKKVKMLEQELNQLKGQSLQQTFKAQDAEIGKKYANYDPNKVDEITAEMLSGKIQATREHLWKVLDYEEAVKRAYQLGKEDRQLDLGEKQSSASFGSSSPQAPSGERMEPEKGENDRNFFKRAFLKNLTESQKK